MPKTPFFVLILVLLAISLWSFWQSAGWWRRARQMERHPNPNYVRLEQAHLMCERYECAGTVYLVLAAGCLALWIAAGGWL